MPEISFRTDFECGNGQNFQPLGPDHYSFELRPDTESDDAQWFYFRVLGARGRLLSFDLLNTGATNIPVHWDNARPVASCDGGKAFAHVSGDTSHRDGIFRFSHQIASEDEHIAFHWPYGVVHYKQQRNLWLAHPHASHDVIGQSVKGRAIDLIRIMNPQGAPDPERGGVWISCRQHAGETSASFTLEGLMNFLLSDEEPAQELRRQAILNVVPMLNPDGVFAGNYRDNILGVNLNRVWNGPDLRTSPEIMAVVDAIATWNGGGHRYDFFLDFHSDSEALSHYCFHAEEGTAPALYVTPDTYYGDTRRFLEMVARRSPDFDPSEGASGAESPGISRTSQMLSYGALAFIFEAGYSKVLFGGQDRGYLTPERHRAVGRAVGEALAEYLLG